MLQWDGEMLPEIRGGRYMYRIAVLVTGYDQGTLPTVSDGTEGEAGSTCVDLVQEHHLPERMKLLSLDTSASNTGVWELALGKGRLSRSNMFT